MTNNTGTQYRNLSPMQTALVADLERKYGTAEATEAVVIYSDAIARGHSQDDALAVVAQHTSIWAAAFYSAIEDYAA